MTDSLMGARLKLNRAREHLEVLNDELAAFMAGEPYRIIHEPNADGSEHVFRGKVIKEPPPRLSVIIGDALQNMRSVLEHLAWGLTPQSTRETSPRSISFPIYTKEAAFFQTDKKTASGYATSSGMHRIWTMDAKARAAIKELQPYNTGDNRLVILNELARIDRHQSLRLIGAVSDSIGYSWRKRGEPSFGMDMSQLGTGTFGGGPFEDGAEVGYIVFNEPEMEVHFQAPLLVTFREERPDGGRYKLTSLNRIRWYIETVVIPKLEGCF